MIYRLDVRPKSATDPLGQSITRQMAELGYSAAQVRTTRIFLIESAADGDTLARVAGALLADPVVETAELVTTAPDDSAHSRIEIHLKPGVMDPVAASTERTLRDLHVDVTQVRTGRAFLFDARLPCTTLNTIASRILANGVIESVYFEPYLPTEFAAPPEPPFKLRHITLTTLDDEALQKLSRHGHLFLSLTEMQTVRDHFREIGREPTDIELETIAQTWSEHCVHKTLKSSVDLDLLDADGKVISTHHFDNLIKDTIFHATVQLMKQDKQQVQANSSPRTALDPLLGSAPFCLSVFKDNAGIVAFDEHNAICFKVETHNHPSAIEPYGGSATGIGGVIRDILGTGLGARPIANTDVFCVAYPDYGQGDKSHQKLPRGIIHPKRILQQIMAGVRDYGNRMGIPTVNGAVYFDDRYLGNPLVFCGCVGIIPRDKIDKAAGHGDAIVVLGGRTGRDGIHGATFSSAELTDTHADEFSHAVQIGNAITEKKVADVILQARDKNLFTGCTDCGAGGLSSAVGEMGEDIGATVHLDRVPLKYAGLTYDEIWISEAQERMVVSVPQQHVDTLLQLCADEDVEATVIGTFGNDTHELILNYHGTQVGRLRMSFLHDGIPMPTRKAAAPASADATIHNIVTPTTGDLRHKLLATLAHPNVASKHWIIRQYDHEVQGGSVIKPLIGPAQIGPSDAAVVRPELASNRAVAIACGMVPHVQDPYAMAAASIDEALRNIVAVGGDPAMTAILDNFCWPSVDDEQTMGTLVRACQACHDVSLAYGIPFISGKDSLHNQFTDTETGRVIRIPNTLLISAIAIVPDARKCITMDLKNPADGKLLLVRAKSAALNDLIATHRAVARAIATGTVSSCHDVSDGGILTAAAEMCIASGYGLSLHCADIDCFGESLATYLLETSAANLASVQQLLTGDASVQVIGTVQAKSSLDINATSITVDELTHAWRGTLDW